MKEEPTGQQQSDTFYIPPGDYDGTRPLWEQVRDNWDKAHARIKELEARDESTSKLILPIIGYMQEEKGGDKFGIRPGEWIFDKVLLILKAIPDDMAKTLLKP